MTPIDWPSRMKVRRTRRAGDNAFIAAIGMHLGLDRSVTPKLPFGGTEKAARQLRLQP